jgi:hypothetical protein
MKAERVAGAIAGTANSSMTGTTAIEAMTEAGAHTTWSAIIAMIVGPASRAVTYRLRANAGLGFQASPPVTSRRRIGVDIGFGPSKPLQRDFTGLPLFPY